MDNSNMYLRENAINKVLLSNYVSEIINFALDFERKGELIFVYNCRLLCEKNIRRSTRKFYLLDAYTLKQLI